MTQKWTEIGQRFHKKKKIFSVFYVLGLESYFRARDLHFHTYRAEKEFSQIPKNIKNKKKKTFEFYRNKKEIEKIGKIAISPRLHSIITTTNMCIWFFSYMLRYDFAMLLLLLPSSSGTKSKKKSLEKHKKWKNLYRDFLLFFSRSSLAIPHDSFLPLWFIVRLCFIPPFCICL